MQASASRGGLFVVSVIGLGKLGSPLAAVLASQGFEVLGVDRNPKSVAALALGQAPVSEPGLQELLARARVPVGATTDIDAAVLRSDVTFVVVPTPTGPDGSFSNTHVLSAVRDIGTALRRKEGYHLVAIASTVMPGSTDGPIREALEDASGRRLGERLGLCYSPQFIALGSVIRDMLNPDLVLIGESDARAGDMLESIYQAACHNQPPVRRMNFVNAELTKIALNAFVTAKISFANMLSEICDQLPGADAAVVTSALGRDSRIGGRYLSPALGFGGPCFPRDNTAFATMAQRVGVRADIPEATDNINRRQLARITELVRGMMARGTVGILGLAYKPDTAVIEDSQGIAIASALADGGYRVLVSDPEALGAAAAVLGSKVEAVATAEECAGGVDLLIIATPWPCFRELPIRVLRRPDRRLPVIDCWRLLPPAEFADTVDLVYLGQPRQPHRQRKSVAAASYG
jgi:UDPglucose 6-dehydrogenase